MSQSIEINLPRNNWRQAVPTELLLPQTGNTVGDAIITQDDLVIYIWDGSTWEPQGGGSGGGVVSVGLSPGSVGNVSNPTTHPVITLNKASTTQDGYLSAADFTTFQNATTGTPNEIAYFNSSGNLASAPGFSIDNDGQLQAFLIGIPSDNVTNFQLGSDVNSALTGGVEGVIVSNTMSSTMNYNSSFNAENVYNSGYDNAGAIGQFQDQSQFNSGAVSGNYSSFGAFPTISGNTNYAAINAGPTLTNTTGGDSLITLSANLNSGYNNTGGFIGINEAVNLNTGAVVNNYTSFNADPNLNSTITTSYTGMSLNPNVNGSMDSFTGLNVSPNVTVNPTSNVTGININLTNFTPSYAVTALTTDGGGTSLNYTLDSGVVDLTAQNPFGINEIGGTLHVASGHPISNGQFAILNNLGIGILADDNIGPDTSGLALGVSDVGFLTQIAIASGKSVDTINLMAAGAGIPSGSGSLTNASMFRALGFVPEGGTISITNLYGFKSDPVLAAIGATNTWGFYDGSGSENFLSKLAIGTSSHKVSNSSVAVEIGNAKGIVFGSVTTVQKLALTAIPGMQVYDTTLNQMSYYNGTTWVNF